MKRFSKLNFIYLLLCALLFAFCVLGLYGCKTDKPAAEAETESDELNNKDEETEPENNEETTSETETTTDLAPIKDIDKIDVNNETTEDAETVTETETETTTTSENIANKITDKYINPLTGVKGTADMSKKRPVAIMINNLKPSLPQVGISQADVLYECLVEGGTTRLMMVVTNYEDLDIVGSVRSSRDYYLDLAQNHDAIYVHAGGSPLAYDNIRSRKINNLDGVNMYIPSMFYRDTERRKTMALEHTLMTTGKGIVSGIEYKKYRTEIKSDFNSPFNFIEYGKERLLPAANPAKHVIIQYNSVQFPQYIYRGKTNTYIRYQYNGQAHMDAGNNTQLEFTNVILLVCKHGDLNDEKGRIGIETTGTGTGYYIYGGRYEKINWSKKTRDTPVVLTNTDGTPLIMNCGKTAINLISPGVEANSVLNYIAPK